MPVRAKVAGQRGSLEERSTLASDAVRLAQTTDALNRRAKANLDLGEVFRLAGRPDEAAAAFARALELYEKKGNLVGAARVRCFTATLRSSRQRKARIGRAFATGSHVALAAAGAAARRIRDERSREREQTDCEHDERAVHEVTWRIVPLLSGSLGAPVTLGPTANAESQAANERLIGRVSR